MSKIEINDIDPAIAAFWREVLGNPDRFCERIGGVELSVREWHRQREIYSMGGVDQFDLGFAAYYLNRTSRSGIIEGSGPIGGYEQESQWTIDARFNRSAQIGQVREIGRFAGSITVTDFDALEFISRRIGRPGTLMYLDPPYYVKGKKLYKNFYAHDDHVRISNVLRKHRKSAWVLSYDHVDPIVALNEGFKPLVYELQYSAGQNGQGKEVIFAGDGVTLPELRYLKKAA